MAIDLTTLDYVCRAQPCVILAPGGQDLTTLDYAFQAQPFVIILGAGAVAPPNNSRAWLILL